MDTFEELLNKLPIPIFVLDEDKNLVYLNKQTLVLSQLSKADLLHKPFSFFIDHFKEEVIYPSFIQEINHPDMFTYRGYEYVIKAYEWRINQKKYQFGFFVNATKNDITLIATLDFIKRINTGICVITKDFHKVILANDKFYEMIGFTQRQFAQQIHSLADILGEKNHKSIQKLANDTLNAGKKTFSFDVDGKTYDGSTIWYHGAAFFTKIENTTYILCAVTDVSHYKETERLLRLNEQRYQIAISQTKNIIWEYDRQYRRIIPQTESYALFGRKGIINKVPECFFHDSRFDEKSKANLKRFFSDIEEGYEHTTCTIKTQKHGSEREHWFRLTNTLTEDRKSSIGVAEDISDYMESLQLYRLEEAYRSSLTSNALASYEIDIDKDRIIESIREDNRDMLEAVGLNINCSFDAFLAVWAKERVHVDDQQKFKESMNCNRLKAMFSSGKREVLCEYRTLNAENALIWCRTIIHLIIQPETGQLCGFVYVKDIDNEKKQEIALLKKSALDYLTGVNNRTTFIDNLQYQLQNHEYINCALFIIDVDNFKSINDTFGHAYGDQVLKDIAYKLTMIFEDEKLIGRYGGDEFIAYLPFDEDLQSVYHKASIIASELNLIYSQGEKDLAITNSIGIAIAPKNGNDFNTLLERADEALYKAKKQGKSTYVLYDENTPFQKSNDAYINKEWLIDELDDIVYIADLETYDLIYLNQIGRKRCNLGVGEYQGRKCYKILQNRDNPCPFCNNSKLTTKDFLVWEYANPFLKRKYIVKDKLVEWNGKTSRMEIAIDITDSETSTQSKASLERTILRCLTTLNDKMSLDEAIGNVLKIIADFFHGERSYIIEIDREKTIAKNTYEFCNEGVVSQKDTLQNIPFHSIPLIFETFDKKEYLIISQVKELKDSYPNEYQFLIKRNVHSLLAVPFEGEETFTGYIGVDNAEINLDCISMLETIALSISNEIKRRRLYEKTEYNNTHDLLTGLLNRNSYQMFVEDTSNCQISCRGVIIADINGLKRINQEYGQQQGDIQIKTIALILKKLFHDYNIFRLSGDEFVVVCDNLEYIPFQEFIHTTEVECDRRLYYGVTLGFTWDDHNIDIHKLLKNAEELLLINKQLYYQESEVNNKHFSTQRLMDLKRVIDEKHFHIMLQPKVSSVDGSVHSAEALVRYNHPKYGIVPPNRFIPMLEKEHLIRYLDFHVFELVCQMLQDWKDQGQVLVPISVNFSRITLLEEDFFDMLTSIKASYDFPNKYIFIEVTETVGVMERKTINEISKIINKAGFKISLDDFGSNFASLSMLPAMDFDELKLDKSLIDNLTDDKPDQIIVKCIIDMCKSLAIKTVAEGVESIEQFRLLKEFGCDLIQGYYFSKPILPENFKKLKGFDIN